jgi:hypothetical protein
MRDTVARNSGNNYDTRHFPTLSFPGKELVDDTLSSGPIEVDVREWIGRWTVGWSRHDGGRFERPLV